MTPSELAATSNGAWIASSSFLAAVAIYALFFRRKDLHTNSLKMCIGVALVGVGVSFHRLWWNLGIWMRPHDRDYATWSTDYRLIPAMVVILVAIGTMVAVSPYMSGVFGRWWPGIFAVWIMLWMLGSYWFA